LASAGRGSVIGQPWRQRKSFEPGNGRPLRTSSADQDGWVP